MVSKDVISPSCIEDLICISMHCLCTMVPIGKRLVGCDCDNLILVLDMIGVVGLCLGLVVGPVVFLLVPSLTRFDCSVVKVVLVLVGY